jgi:formylmethanofuran:tetrahydromethanopterin formyltransferase
MIHTGDKIKFQVDGYEVEAVVTGFKALGVEIKAGDFVKILGPSLGDIGEEIGQIHEVQDVENVGYETWIHTFRHIYALDNVKKIVPEKEWYD